MTRMRFDTWDLVFNLAFFLFWFRIWTEDDRDLCFNPYLAPLGRVTDGMLEFLRPVFLGLRTRWIAALAFAFLVVLRGLAIPRAGTWLLQFGFETGMPVTRDLLSCVLFSALSFGVFLFRLWGLSLIFARTRGTDREHTVATVHHLSRPFTDARAEIRPAVLLLYGMLLAAAVHWLSDGVSALRIGGAVVTPRATGTLLAMRFVISALAGWVQVLPLIQMFLIVLIIGSWVSMFSAAQNLIYFCREWMDLLMGPLRRYPIRIGMFDLTPIVLMFVLSFIHRFLWGLLRDSYIKLL